MAEGLGTSLAVNWQCLAGTKESRGWGHILSALDIGRAQPGTCAVWYSCTGPLGQKCMTQALCKLGKITVIIKSTMAWPWGRRSSMPPMNKTLEIHMILSAAGNVSVHSVSL